MTRYWASYGRTGFFGSFSPIDDSSFPRGETVIIDSMRGRELATILGEVEEPFASSIPSSGSILRKASDDDRQLAEQLSQRATAFLKLASDAAASLPLLLADAEMLLDERTLILHAMPWDEVELTAWLEELSQRFGLAVQLLNLAELPREKLDPAGCGKPNCGEGGGGCSTGGCASGSCSKGSVKSAEELTAYFSNLRQAMETKRVALVE